MKRISIALVLSMGAATSPAWADDPIATDRPDFVESSQTVGLGRWQIETSVATCPAPLTSSRVSLGSVFQRPVSKCRRLLAQSPSI